jgi:quercetin dioxygenase-like cupin family protein
MADKTETAADDSQIVRDPSAGEAIWLLGGEFLTVKVAGKETDDRLAVVEHRTRGGFATPLHAHPLEEETFYVLEGELSFVLEGREQRAAAGSLVLVPPGAPHAFRVEGEQARFLTVHTPAGHERFYRAAGEPAAERTLPPPTEPDLQRVQEAAAAHNVELLGPPPWQAI